VASAGRRQKGRHANLLPLLTELRQIGAGANMRGPSIAIDGSGALHVTVVAGAETTTRLRYATSDEPRLEAPDAVQRNPDRDLALPAFAQARACCYARFAWHADVQLSALLSL
jgi:hypothetical protein